MGLERFDLIYRVRTIFGIDLYEPKSGTIEEFCILSFLCENKYIANDLCNFIDKGAVPFVADSEPSPGPNLRGQYLVYVEIERNKLLPENILKLLKDIKNITNISKWHFIAYPDADNPIELSPESLLNVFAGGRFEKLMSRNIEGKLNEAYYSQDPERILKG